MVRTVNSVLNKGKSAIPPPFNSQEVLPSLLKAYIRTLILIARVSLYRKVIFLL